ncbi:MAG: acyltransferase [Bacteroidales bacterium]|nr:acyltransferase [Bacteroidales bacterium]
MRSNFPCIRPIHLPLYYLRIAILNSLVWCKHSLWDVPLFKSRCKIAGNGLKLPNGQPLIVGNLALELGENVTIMRSTLGASTVFDNPVLKVGNNTTLGYGTVISVAQEVSIGNNTLIGPQCLVMDNDDHPINPVERLARMPVRKKDVKPVKIGNNVWLGTRAIILRGVIIGDNSIVGANSVVAKNIPPNSIATGFPARVVKAQIDKSS